MTYPISDVTRRVVYSGSAGTGPYSFSFEILNEGDIAVYENDTLLTITTDYTVTINADGTGSVTLVSASTASDTVAILGNKGIERQTDFVTGGDLFATSLNDELDAQTIFAQQNAEAVSRAIKIPPQSSLSIDTTLPVPQGGYILGWNDSGDAILNLQEIGSYQGTDATTTTANYNNRDIVKDSSNNNVYICTATSTAGTLLTNTSYWALLVDAAAAASSASSASGFADEAEEWATKVDGIVESTDYSSKAWSIGGTGVTTTSGKGAAKEWATSTGAAVDTSEYSAKEYAVGDLTATGGSAKAWAIDSSSPDGSSEKSAKTLAGEAATSASNAATSESNAADWAVKTDGIVDATDYAAKAWSIGGTGVTDTASAGAAKEWATKAEDSTVDGTEYSAKHYSAKAAASASAAASDAAGVAALYDAFDDRYLGSKASDPALDNDGAALTDGALYFNTTSNVLKVYDLGSTTWLTIPQLTLATLTDVTLTSIASGEILKWNGSEWINNTLGEAGIVGTAGSTMTGDLSFGDNVKANFGAGADLKIYHSGSASYILDSGTGDLNIMATDLTLRNSILETYIACTSNGSVDLYYDNSAKLATTTNGVSVTGRAVGTLTTDNDLSFDMNASNQFKCTPTANGTLTFTNITAGQSGNIFLVNSGGYAISAAATTYISAADLSAISTAGSYFLSYFSDGTNVMVSASAAVTSAGA